jgi:hypothetical protein
MAASVDAAYRSRRAAASGQRHPAGGRLLALRECGLDILAVWSNC